MNRRWPARFMAVTAGLVAVLGAARPWAANAVPPDEQPTVEVVNEPFPDDIVVTGATFKLVGRRWPANTLIEVEVCGNEARSGTSDCAVESAQLVASDQDGQFRARVSVVIPPTPCPCVVRAVSQADGTFALVDVEVPGAPVKVLDDADVVKPAMRKLDVNDVSLMGSDDWQAWLGGHPQRTLEFTVTNTGDVALKNATVALTVGSSDEPTGFVAPVELGQLDVMQTKTYRIPVTLDALSWGRQVVKASFTGTTEPTSFSAATSSYPWLLIAIPIALVLQAALVITRNLLRRRLNDTEPGDEAGDGSSGPPEPQPGDSDRREIAAGSGEAESAEREPAQLGPAADEFAGELTVGTPDDRRADDDCIICVLEYGEPPLHTVAHDRTLTVVRGLSAVKRALLEHAAIPSATGGGVTAPSSPPIEVVTIMGVDLATLRQAHQASVELDRWIEQHLGLKKYVTSGAAAESLFRCDGVTTVIDGDGRSAAGGIGGWCDATNGYSNVFFSGQATGADLHGLVPLAVYARRDPSPRRAPRRWPTEAYGHEMREIRTMGEMFDHLLERGRVLDREQRERELCNSARFAVMNLPGGFTEDGDPLGGSPSVSSEPPENTAQR